MILDVVSMRCGSIGVLVCKVKLPCPTGDCHAGCEVGDPLGVSARSGVCLGGGLAEDVFTRGDCARATTLLLDTRARDKGADYPLSMVIVDKKGIIPDSNEADSEPGTTKVDIVNTSSVSECRKIEQHTFCPHGLRTCKEENPVGTKERHVNHPTTGAPFSEGTNHRPNSWLACERNSLC